MNDWVEYAVDSIHVSLTTQQRMLVLKDLQQEVFIPIWVGTFEVDTIVIGLQEIEVSRPQTTDLLREAIEALGGTVRKVELTKIQDETFYANLVIESAGETVRIDARPSDAIALAVRCRVPIFVAAAVIEQAGIRPDEDIRDTIAYRSAAFGFVPEADTVEEPINPEDLLVFDSFLKNLSSSGASQSDEMDDENDRSDPDDDRDEDSAGDGADFVL